MPENISPAPQGEQPSGGLLLAARRITAARARTEQPSDNTGGRSDMND